jgi:hypothetical protein
MGSPLTEVAEGEMAIAGDRADMRVARTISVEHERWGACQGLTAAPETAQMAHTVRRGSAFTQS